MLLPTSSLSALFSGVSELALTRVGVSEPSAALRALCWRILAYKELSHRSSWTAGFPLLLLSVLGEVFAVQLENLLIASFSTMTWRRSDFT